MVEDEFFGEGLVFRVGYLKRVCSFVEVCFVRTWRVELKTRGLAVFRDQGELRPGNWTHVFPVNKLADNIGLVLPMKVDKYVIAV